MGKKSLVQEEKRGEEQIVCHGKIEINRIQKLQKMEENLKVGEIE